MGRAPLNAGTNFHDVVASLRELSNKGLVDAADRIFPAESITRSGTIVVSLLVVSPNSSTAIAVITYEPDASAWFDVMLHAPAALETP